MKRLILAVLAVAGMVGCSSVSERQTDWYAMEQARQARLDTMAAACETDLCLVMIAQEAGRAAPMPQERPHPVWNLLNTALQIGLPAYAAVEATEAWGDIVTGVSGTIASMDTADRSINIGGDQIGGDRIDDRSSNAGRDLIGGDQRIGDDIGRDNIGGDQRIGDDIRDSCVGDACRNSSPGPIDESDNSVTNPPPEPAPPGG